MKRATHGLDWSRIDGFLNELAVIIEPVVIRFQWRPLLTDAGDEMVIEAAINAQSDAIVTHNRRDFEPASSRFGIQVLLPAEALAVFRNQRR